MKAILEFNLPEEQLEFQMASKASDMYAALWDIAQEVFRPARKHGYANEAVQNLLDKADEIKIEHDSAGTELISQLEKMFYEILDKHEIKL